MKRSRINELQREAVDFFDRCCFRLPPWAFWSVDEWKANYDAASEIRENALGWDLTDFGSGDFEKIGLLLFTLRNGNPKAPPTSKQYAEKIMIVREGQVTPTHYHWSKMEDIINRGGGVLVMELWQADENDGLSEEPVTVSVDGVKRTFPAGQPVEFHPGESITLTRKLYHRFYGKPGAGLVLVGEVSSVNDDDVDNRFLDAPGRFPEIEEDEPPLYLLVKDYEKFLG